MAAGTDSALDECLGGVVHHGVEDLDGDAARAGVGRRHRVYGGLARSVKHNGLHGWRELCFCASHDGDGLVLVG